MTRSIFLLFALILGLCWLPPGWTGQPGETEQQPQRVLMTLTITDNGKEIEVKQEDALRVELEGAGATGYLWQIRDLDRSRLDLVNQSTRVLLSDGRMGGPVLSVFTFKALSKGTVVLTIDYFRPWEGREKSEKTFSVKINIV
ncbi:MAG TPA: hypothetical protein DCR97_10170 [Deltaproteobacteria bacterium]|nr:hypothetical protein [Deltaproteobacteria bacterium]